MMKYIIIFFVFLLSFSCKKKYTCACDGYEGLKKIKRYKIRADSYSSAEASCKSYANGSGGNLDCYIE